MMTRMTIADEGDTVAVPVSGTEKARRIRLWMTMTILLEVVIVDTREDLSVQGDHLQDDLVALVLTLDDAAQVPGTLTHGDLVV